MNKILLTFIIIIVLMTSAAFAQSGGVGVRQSGTVTAGHCTSWLSTNVIQDAGSACGGGSGTGTVSSVSVATANGFSGTVANPTTTPAITIIAGAITPSSVNVTGGVLTLGVANTTLGTLVLEGSTSGAVTVQPAATAGTWSLTLPTTGGTSGYVLSTNGSGVTSWANPALSSSRAISSGTTDTATTSDNTIFWNNTGSLTTPTTENLYAGTTINQTLYIIDEVGSWGQGNLIAVPSGTQTINGSAQFICNQNFNSAELRYDGSSNWYATCR